MYACRITGKGKISVFHKSQVCWLITFEIWQVPHLEDSQCSALHTGMMYIPPVRWFHLDCDLGLQGLDFSCWVSVFFSFTIIGSRYRSGSKVLRKGVFELCLRRRVFFFLHGIVLSTVNYRHRKDRPTRSCLSPYCFFLIRLKKEDKKHS